MIATVREPLMKTKVVMKMDNVDANQDTLVRNVTVVTKDSMNLVNSLELDVLVSLGFSSLFFNPFVAN